MSKLQKLLNFAALALVFGCTGQGGPVLNPVGRTLTWFSYVGGADLRAACQPGAADALRFVYNGRYTDQVRTYDVTTDPVGPGAVFLARANDRSNILALNLSDPFGTWRGAVYQHFISLPERDALWQALAASGFNRPAPSGLYLRSDAYYWTVSACRQGVFHFYAWQEPGDDLTELAFVPVLLNLDKTGVDYNVPRDIPLGPFDPAPRAHYVAFQLEVGNNGLIAGPSF